MRYADGGGLTAESRARREDVRLQAARLFEQHGVPFTIKECFDLAGTPTTAGWKMLANWKMLAKEYPSKDAPDVQRLKAAGAIPIVDGPMARRVADLWTAFEVMAGPTWRDPRTVPAPLRGPRLRPPLEVAVVLDPAGGGINPHVQDGVQTAATVLADAGYAVEETEPPGIAEAAQVALSILNTPDFRALLPHLELFEAPTRQFLTEFYDAAGDPDPVTTITSFMTRHALLRQVGRVPSNVPADSRTHLHRHPVPGRH